MDKQKSSGYMEKIKSCVEEIYSSGIIEELESSDISENVKHQYIIACICGEKTEKVKKQLEKGIVPDLNADTHIYIQKNIAVNILDDYRINRKLAEMQEE